MDREFNSFSMRELEFPSVPQDHSRTISDSTRSGGHSTQSTTPNPFNTPGSSIYNGFTSGYGGSETGGGKGYFRSRRIRLDKGHKPPKFKKDPKEVWLWVMPMVGIFVGLAITGVLIYFKIGRTAVSNFCSVLNEDFSSGTLNPAIWTMEQEVGGFGNQQFDMTTADAENVFIKDGQLYIKPTLQDEDLINNDNIIDLRMNGACTSDVWSNCIAGTNATNGTIVPPTKSGRVNTKIGASIKYGRVEVKAKIPQGDWLWPAIWLLPVTETYGAWPASGEIDIMESRGNNYTYSLGGNNQVVSALHWGPDPSYDGYHVTSDLNHALHSQFGDQFHTYGLEWTDKYLFTFVDTRLLQVYYHTFSTYFWPQGNFPYATANGTRLINPWSQTGRFQTPFDQEFYLILNVAVGGQNGWFLDGNDGKPWVDASPSARMDFWKARDRWYPTWEKNGQMIVDSVKMWQKC